MMVLQQITAIACVAAVSTFFGMHLGSRLSCSPKLFNAPDDSWSSVEIPLRVEEHTFLYNKTFGDDPKVNPGTLAAWDSIVPLGQGSVRYPADKPEVFTLSAIHQLHCLWTIHYTFYKVLHAVPDDYDQEDISHMRHCFDYLRQSLSCASDTTLEPVVPHLGGVTGWNVPRRCRSFADLKSWAEMRRVSNAIGFSASHMGHK